MTPWTVPSGLPPLPEGQYWKRRWGGFGPWDVNLIKSKPRRVVLDFILLLLTIALVAFVAIPLSLPLLYVAGSIANGGPIDTGPGFSDFPEGYAIVVGSIGTAVTGVFAIRNSDKIKDVMGLQETEADLAPPASDDCPACRRPYKDPAEPPMNTDGAFGTPRHGGI